MNEIEINVENIIAPQSKAEKFILAFESKYIADLKEMASDPPPEKIENDEDQQICEIILKERKAWVTEVESDYKPLTSAAHQLHKMLTGSLAKITTLPETQIGLMGNALGVYHFSKLRKIEKDKEEALKKAQEEAQKKAVADFMNFNGGIEPSESQMEEIKEQPLTLILPEEEVITKSIVGVRYTSKLIGHVPDIQKLCAEIGRGVLPVGLVKIDQSAINKYLKMGGSNPCITSTQKEGGA